MKRSNAIRVVLAGTAFALASHSAAGQRPAVFGSKPVFDEEFKGDQVNLQQWSHRGVGKRDFCQVDPNAVSVENGHARIRIFSAKDSDGNITHHCGAISTQHSFLHTYGYWEASLRFQNRPGIQTSFWIQSPTIGKTVGDPQHSGIEMDVFEHVSSQLGDDVFDYALHWDGYKAESHKTRSHFDTYKALRDGKFHTFAVAWTPGGLSFYIDGKLTWSQSKAEAPVSEAEEYLILDTELPSDRFIPKDGYGPLGDSRNAYLDVDYVRVYPYTGPVAP